MKTLATSLTLVAALCSFATAQLIEEKTQTVTTTTSGMVGELTPETLVIRQTNAAPASYRFTESTQYVDENGDLVSREVIKTGVPVTVYSERVGDQLIASKVVVKTSSTAVPAETRTVESTTSTMETTGTITELGSSSVMIRTENSGPTRYAFSEKTEYVDAAGNTVSREVIKSGVPVRLHYIQDGDRLIVRRVTIQSAAPAAETIEKTTTTTTTVEE